MAAAPGARCAEIARGLDEPLVGSAPSTRRWLCLERAQPWPVDIDKDPDPRARSLLTRAAGAGFRPLLIQSPHGGPSSPRIFLADTAPGRTAVTALTVERPEQLDDLPLPAPGQRPLPGLPVDVPLFLVCTHEQRDPCCGIDGRALLDAVAGPGVFACSHLGGHRHAPTALVLPTGYAYGRLDPWSAAAVRDAAASGLVRTDRCRGRSTWSPHGQVAELAVREATGLRPADALIVEDDAGDTVQVRAVSGERWAVDVEAVEVDVTRPVSCGARFTLMNPLRAAAVRRVHPGSS